MEFTRDQVDLMHRTVAAGCSADELAVFLHVCQRTGLDPLTRQIYVVLRYDKDKGRKVPTIQTSIDGMRVCADRTGEYAPGGQPTFQYTTDDRLVSATSYVKKRTSDGTWHEVAATAFLEEYVKESGSAFWGRMPHVMLSKVAEAQALRRAFPAALGGLYAAEEMALELPSTPEPPPTERVVLPTVITESQRRKLFAVLQERGISADALKQHLATAGIHSTKDIPRAMFEPVLAWVLEHEVADAPL